MAAFCSPDDLAFASLCDQLIRSHSRLNFGIFRPLAHWYSGNINFPFLRGALHFWDPDTHLFRIGIDELCPTYEEFSAILRIPIDQPMAVPVDARGPRVILSGLLHIPAALCAGFITQGKLDLRPLVRFFLNRLENPVYSHGHTLSAVICLVSKLLLVTGSFLVDPKILIMIEQALAGRSLIPVVLAETLNGLDAVYRNECTFFKGSPMLLFIWLTERFRFASTSSPRLLQDSSYFFRRTIFSENRVLASDWPRGFAESSRLIRWSIPWWGLRCIVSGTGGHYYIRFCGLTHTSFYLPGRLLRQFNVSQNIPHPLHGFTSETIFVDTRRSASLQRAWDSRNPHYFRVFGISHPLPAPLIQSIWNAHQSRFLADPLQMMWFKFMRTTPTSDNIVLAYQVMDTARIERAAEDAPWIPLENN